MIWFWEALLAFPAWVLITLVRGYKLFLSPLLGRNCRYTPTCSIYFIGAVQKDGAFWGSIRGIARILRCNPWTPGGYDPP